MLSLQQNYKLGSFVLWCGRVIVIRRGCGDHDSVQLWY